MISAALIAESYVLLNQARMIAEAPAAQAAEVARKRSRRRPPQGKASEPGGYQVSTLQQCGQRMNLAIAHDSEPELAAANRWCASELDSLRHRPAGHAETKPERIARIGSAYEGVLAGVVAREERMSVTQVRDLRVAGGREARTGRRLAGKGLGGVSG